MRVDTIELYSNDNQIISFNVAGPDPSNPYILKGMTGLDGDTIVPRFYGQGSNSLRKFYDLVLDPREIVMKIGLNPDYGTTVPADLRGEIYKAVYSSRSGTVQIRFLFQNNAVAAISGFVTKVEAATFVQEPECQLTIRCDDPILKATYTTSLIVADLDEAEPLITDAISTFPHGFHFKVTFTGTVNPFVIQDDPSDPDWFWQINFNFDTGNELYFSSEKGDKYLYVVKDGDTIHLMDVVGASSLWPLIFPGENQFYIPDTDFVWNEVYFTETHLGV